MELLKHDDDEVGIFAHFQPSKWAVTKSLISGQKFEFEINEGPRGLQTQSIRSVSN